MTREYMESVERSADGKTRTDNELYKICDCDYAFDCESEDCAFNNEGRCRYYAVYEDMPIITEEDGCLSGVLPS